MKVKRQGAAPKVSAHSTCLMMSFGVLAFLSLFLGEIYHIPSRFSTPLFIVMLWIGGAMALWRFGKRRNYDTVKQKRER